MRHRGVWLILAVVVAVGFFVARAWAPEEGAASEKPKGEAAQAKGEKTEAEGERAEGRRAEGEMMCPFCGGMMKAGEGARAMAGPMRMRHRMMMRMAERLSAEGPGSILALREDLKLTGDQVHKLEEIEHKARHDAEDVLTEEQREILDEVPDQNDWMRALREGMRERRTEGERRMEGERKEGERKEGAAAKEGESEKHEH
jgi:hypothetical protein